MQRRRFAQLELWGFTRYCRNTFHRR